jgi:hypothetical protein
VLAGIPPRVSRPALLVTLILAVVACGVPVSPVKQAEDIGSIAAEGALLAGDTAEGDTTTQFAETHAQALQKNAESVAAAITHGDLRQVAADVVAALEQLGSSPDDRGVAGKARARLEAATKQAEEIAKAGS